MDFTGASQMELVVKKLPAHAGDIRDVGSISGLERCPGGERGKPLQRIPGEFYGQRSLEGYSP